MFEDGTVVGWGMTEADRQSIINLIESHVVSKNSELDVTDEETMPFEFGQVSTVDGKRDTIVLTKQNEWTEKTVYSLGFSRSVKLDDIEVKVENALELPKSFNFYRLPKKEKKCSPRKELAVLFNLNYNLIAESKVEDFLWDKPESLRKLYGSISKYLELDSRAKTIEEKLHPCLSYWKLENEYEMHKYEWRLERLIILFIFIEIILLLMEKSERWENFRWEQLLP